MKRLLTDLGLLASQQVTSSRCDNSHLGHLKPLYIIRPVYKNSQNTIGDTLAVHLHNVFCALVFLFSDHRWPRICRYRCITPDLCNLTHLIATAYDELREPFVGKDQNLKIQ